MLFLNSLLMAAGLIACFYMTVFVLSHKSPSIFLKTLSPIGCSCQGIPYPNIPGPMAALRSPMRLADRVTRRWSPRIMSVLSSPSTSLRYTSESPELATSTCLSLAIVGIVHWSVRIVKRSGSPAPFPGPRSGVFKSSQKRLMRSSRMDMCALARMILSSTICGLTRA